MLWCPMPKYGGHSSCAEHLGLLWPGISYHLCQLGVHLALIWRKAGQLWYFSQTKSPEEVVHAVAEYSYQGPKLLGSSYYTLADDSHLPVLKP